MTSWNKFLAGLVLAGGMVSQGAWAAPSRSSSPSTNKGQPLLPPAVQVGHIVDLDGDGITERVLLGAGGKCVRIVSRSLGAFEFPLIGHGLAVLPFDWVPGGAPELVIATRRGIVVHSLDGRLLEARVAKLESAALAEVARTAGETPSLLPSVLLVSRAHKSARAEVHLLRPRHPGLRIGVLPAASTASIGDAVGRARFQVRLSGKLRFVPVTPQAPVALRLPPWAV